MNSIPVTLREMAGFMQKKIESQSIPKMLMMILLEH